MSGHHPIDFNISKGASNTLNFTLANYAQSLQVFWIYFYSIINCTANTVWNSSTYTCQSCPIDGNGNCVTCDSVWFNCSQCNSTSCEVCTSPSILDGTNCTSCSDKWPGCDSCTESNCSNCSAPYVLNVSSCFLCNQTWANCQNCNSSMCLDCGLNFRWNGS